MWWIYALLSALFAAITAIFIKVGVKGINSDLATAIRTIVILIITWGIVFFKTDLKELHKIGSRNFLFLFLSGVATGLSWLFYFRALQSGKIAEVAAVDKLSVAIAIILSLIFLGETVSLKTALGAGLITIGAIIIIF